MAFANMWFEIAGELGMPTPLAQTKINEALGSIYDDDEQRMWSFQIRSADNWLTPGLLFSTGTQSAGTITATPYSNTIVGDATAAAAWVAYLNAGTLPLLTSFQIRSPYYSLYNIIAFDGVNTFTLDRNWMEPGGSGLAYMMYQAYFPTPTADFKRFFEIRDTTNSGVIDYWSKSQKDLSVADPERTIFDQPTHAVFYGWDTRGAGTVNASPTLGYPLFELWPHPLSVLPYTFSSLRRGSLLVNPSDTVPAPLTEDMVKWKTREACYLFKESQKGDGVARGSGADWKFLAQAAAAEYKKARNRIGKADTSIVDLFFSRFNRDQATHSEPFATINSGLNVGGW